MNNFYTIDVIPSILKRFKVNTVIISGIKDENLINTILKYNAKFTQINTNDAKCISENPLDALQKLENYDAIFIDDDPNWYTLFNELEIITKNNKEFPLVFICNNNFPNKRRDSYSNPNIIPADYRQEYTTKLPIPFNDEQIIITDGFFHACDENTPKNGVLTAIEDFIKKNSYVGMEKIYLNKEICILYSKSQINQKRISIINKDIQNKKISDINILDKLLENQLLISYIDKHDLNDTDLLDIEAEISRKDLIIKDYEKKINYQNHEINLKDSQINRIESDLSLKDSKIKNIESKLINKNKKIDDLENQLKTENSNLTSLIDNNQQEINNLEYQLKTANSEFDFLSEKINESADEFTQRENSYNNKIDALNTEINSLKNKINQKEMTFENTENKLLKQIKIKNNQLEQKQQQYKEEKRKLDSIEHFYMKNLSYLENKEYCIHCLKEENSNYSLEIEYIKKNKLTRKLLSPLAYLYLIFKSKHSEISLNIKLFQTLKNSKCFDIGYYLNKNKDLIDSKWCKYFSPELHYICNGFYENRSFNKKYFNRNSKKDLLEYLLNCGE